MNNRADRRRNARQIAKVVAISPAVRQATEHLAKIRRQSKTSSASSDAAVDAAVRDAQGQGYSAVDFVIHNNDTQVLIKFDRPISLLVLSAEKTAKVIAALELARDEVLTKKKPINTNQPQPTADK